MKDAFSNLLSEYVGAHEVDYQDIANFQIVCPCCREPIFKVSRHGAEKEINFFSHYKASLSFTVDECERRVGGLSEAAKSAVNTASRNQSLAMFRSVIRDATKMIPVRGKILPESIVKGNEAFYASYINTIALVVDEKRDSFCEAVINDSKLITDTGQNDLTPFASAFNRRVADDLIRSLFSQKANKSTAYIVARAYNTVFELILQPNGKPKFEPVGRAKKIFSNPRIQKIHDGRSVATNEDDLRRFHAISSSLMLDAIAIELQRLPFLKMIQNSSERKHPLAGLTISDFQPDLDDEAYLAEKPEGGLEIR